MILNDGRPLVVESENDRIGRGAWARLLAAAGVQDESSSTAERGRALARSGAVHTVSVARGELAAQVTGDDGEHSARITADRMPPRIWSAMVRAARGNPPLEAGVVLAVEPKVFYPGLGGVGTENTYVINDSGCERLTLCPQEIYTV